MAKFLLSLVEEMEEFNKPSAGTSTREFEQTTNLNHANSTLGSNNVSICASLGTHAYLCVQQKVCWHTSPMRTIKMLHSSMLTCITHVCSRSYISHVGMLEHSILIAPMGQHTRGFQEQNYYVMYFIKFTWFQLQNKMFHISLHTWIRPHITGWCKSA